MDIVVDVCVALWLWLRVCAVVCVVEVVCGTACVVMWCVVWCGGLSVVVLPVLECRLCVIRTDRSTLPPTPVWGGLGLGGVVTLPPPNPKQV